MKSITEYKNKIIEVLETESRPVNPSVIQNKLGWNKDDTAEVCQIFNVKSFTQILETIEGVSITKNEHGTSYVSYGGEKNMNNTTETKNQNTEIIPIRDRFEELLAFLNSGLYEKEEAIRLALLSAVAGESIFFLGPPGTAKSMISSRIHKAFKEDTKYFEYLMNEFSTPDEIFGSIKLKGLDEGIYEKNTSGYLPEANIAFLDEIWKSGPAILNTLLTIINEKKFRNGNKINKVPLQILLAASNELPKEKAGLEALYDRFIIRTFVNPVSMKNEDSFFALCEKSGKELNTTDAMKQNLLSIEEIAEWQGKIDEVILDEKIKEVIMEIRRKLVVKNQEKNREEKEKFYVSDRRWKKIVHLLKTSAFLCDRPAVDLMDCQLITYCSWNTPKQREEVQKIVKDIVQEHGLESTTAIEDIEDQIEKFENNVDSTWYKMSDKQTHQKAVTKKDSDNRIYYKLQSNDKGIGYISKKPPESYNPNRYYYYDENFQNKRYIDNITIDEKQMAMYIYNSYYNYNNYALQFETKTVVDDEGGLVKDTVLFNNAAAYSATKEKFDSEQYSPIANAIESELKKLSEFRENVEKPYTENLFAEQSFKEIITSKIEEAKKKLEDAKVTLDKQKSRYEA